MLKITKTHDTSTGVHLKLEGRVIGQWAYLLDGTCRAYLRDKKTVELDCADVEFVDAHGADVLKNLPRKRVKLLSVPQTKTPLQLTGE